MYFIKEIRVTWRNEMTDTDWLEQSKTNAGMGRLRLAGHIIRMAPERGARNAFNWIPADDKRGRG